MEELIQGHEIFLQDIVYDAVSKDPEKDEVILYNRIIQIIDVDSLHAASRILELIKLNKRVLLL